MSYTILKDFPFSTDGINQIQAVASEERDDIPEVYIAGLEDEGYIAARSRGGAPENKMIDRSPEDKDELARLRDRYKDVIGKQPFMGWDKDELEKRIAEAGE